MKKFLLPLLICFSTTSCVHLALSFIPEGERENVKRQLQEATILTAGQNEVLQGFSSYRWGNYAKTQEHWQDGCDLGTGQACFLLGFLHNNGEGLPQDGKKAMHYFQKGCNLDFPPSCEALKEMKWNDGKPIDLPSIKSITVSF